MAPQVDIVLPGDTSKRCPFTILIIANSWLESPRNSGNFVSDPVIAQPAAFKQSVSYICDSLFCKLANQVDPVLSDFRIGPNVRVISVFDVSAAQSDSCSLVAEHEVDARLLVPRRQQCASIGSSYGIEPDIVFAVTASPTHTRASAFFSTDDPSRAGVLFTASTLGPQTFMHCYYASIPGTIAIHISADFLTASHEFMHAISSYNNGSLVDLYAPGGPGLNRVLGRPIPVAFGSYQASQYQSDPSRDHLSYPYNWRSIHCELIDPACPAMMDNYYQTSVPNACQNDRITRDFVMDRLLVKIGRPDTVKGGGIVS